MGLYIGELITTAWTVDQELSTRTRNGKDPDGQLRNSYTKVDRRGFVKTTGNLSARKRRKFWSMF